MAGEGRRRQRKAEEGRQARSSEGNLLAPLSSLKRLASVQSGSAQVKPSGGG